MKDKDYSVIESLGRINRFAINHLAAFPAGSPHPSHRQHYEWNR
jgi:hypothetical protein